MPYALHLWARKPPHPMSTTPCSSNPSSWRSSITGNKRSPFFTLQRMSGLVEGRRSRGQLEQSPASSFTEPVASPSREDFKTSVERAKEHIRAGDIIQAVISRTFKMPRFCDPFDIYRGLRRINPSPYMYYIETPDVEIAGASPEVMVRVDEGQMLVRPIAGTRKRGEMPKRPSSRRRTSRRPQRAGRAHHAC